MKNFLSLILITLFSVPCLAKMNLYDVKVGGVRLYDKFLQAGVPAHALERVFEFLDVNSGKTVQVMAKVRTAAKPYLAPKDITIQSHYAAIIDFSLPSNQRRLYVLDLRSGAVTKHFVAHGKGSGVVEAAKFSNIGDSKMSSLGLYLAGDTYKGKHGISLNLFGLEASNSKAASRDIVMHSANYVSEDYAKRSGRLGRSWGCPAVSPGIIGKMINLFGGGGVIYAYHKDVNAKILKNPSLQVVSSNDKTADVDLPGEEETLNAGQSEGVPPQGSHIPTPMPRPEIVSEPKTVEEAIAAAKAEPPSQTPAPSN